MANSNPRTNSRCHHCAGLLSKEMETSEWTVAPLVRDSFSMIGSAVDGTTSAFYGFNHVMPIVRRWERGSYRCISSPVYDQVPINALDELFIKAPPMTVSSSACAHVLEKLRHLTLLGHGRYVALMYIPALCLEEKLKELKQKLESMNREQPWSHDGL